MHAESNSSLPRPSWVGKLEQTFGGPNQSAFGTAVFFEAALPDDADLEQLARKWYQFFCGATWEKFGPENWLSTWQRVDPDSSTATTILDELANLEDAPAKLSGATLLDGSQDPAAAKQALSRGFDDPAIGERHIYRIGDGAAMSGILIAARRSGGEAACLTFLLD